MTILAVNLVTWIALGAIALFVLAIVGISLAKKATGSVKVSIDRTNYRVGETIHGTVQVVAKRPVEYSSLSVAVRCVDVNDDAHPGPVEVAARRLELAGAGRLAADDTLQIPFSIVVPEVSGGVGLSVDATEAVPDRLAELVGHAAARAAANLDRQRLWSVEGFVENDLFALLDVVTIDVED